jgi:predicted Zn-dependent protease
MKKTISLALLIAVALLALPAAAQFPRLPGGGKLPGQDKVDQGLAKAKPFLDKAKPFMDANKSWSPDDEQQVGEESAAKIIHVFGLWTDKPGETYASAMTKYVNLVANVVAKQGTRSDVQYHVAILDSEVMNAMATPGGFIFVTRGALANMKNESELAGVLAHEIAHVDGRHLENELKQKGTMNAATKEITQDVKNTSSDQMMKALIQKAGDMIAQAVLTSPFSSGDEANADKNGTDMASRAGYAPSGLRDFLQTLAAASGDDQFTKKTGAWGQTHPPLPDRVANLTKLIANYTAPGQPLADRYTKNVNDLAFGNPPPPPPPPPPAAKRDEKAPAKSAPATKKSAPPAKKKTPAPPQ